MGVILAAGWRRCAIAFLAGALGALAMPPLAWTPAMIAPMAAAVWLIDGSHARPNARLGVVRSAFSAGWWMGFGYFLCGLWWVGAAFLVEASKFAWALPLGVGALPAGLALFWGAGFAVARLLWRAGPERVFALAFGLGTMEWTRGLVFTGFPWNDLGMALGSNLVLAQIAALIGLHGLTYLSIAIFAAPATLWRFSETRFDVLPTIGAAGALALIAAFGWVRLTAPPSPTVAGVKLRLIQPNVSQGAEFSPENREAILARYFDLSDRDVPGGVQAREITHLIWPESAFPFLLSRDADAMSQIVEFLRDGETLITGAARMDEKPGAGARYYNSIQIMTGAGLAAPRYDKTHLVPFGEYVPFQGLLDWAGITQFVHIPGGFSPGTGRRALTIPGLPPAIPLICYEAIFPEEAGAALSGEPGSWLLNVTDDAWFGLTPGPYQHFAQARLRAIELGLPLVRDANSGISAVVDGFGREIAAAPLGVETVVDASLPQPLPATWQRRFGSLGALAIAILCFLASRNPGGRREL
jgi:apolipoprotein N-acyltransferase